MRERLGATLARVRPGRVIEAMTHQGFLFLRERVSMFGLWFVILMVMAYASYRRDVMAVANVQLLSAAWVPKGMDAAPYAQREILYALWFALTPLVVCFVSPRLGLSIYFAMVSVRFVGTVLWHLTNPVAFPFPVVFSFFSLLIVIVVIWLCPAFSPAWRHCNVPGWNTDQFIDPLNIRRHAAPWKIINLFDDKET
jgi:hypothetical protein